MVQLGAQMNLNRSATFRWLTTLGLLCGVGLVSTEAFAQKITFGEMRSDGGPTGILVYCADYTCSHSMAIDQWPDDLRSR